MVPFVGTVVVVAAAAAALDPFLVFQLFLFLSKV